MKTINTIFERILDVLSMVLSIVLAAVVVIICLQTFFRYVVFHSLAWSEELTRYLFIFIVSCGFGIGISKGALIRINIVDGFFGVRGMQFMQILYDTSGVFVCFVLCRYNLLLIKTGMTRLTSALAPVRFGHVYMVMEIGYILSLLASVLQLIKSITACCSYKKEESAE